jgi:hypothetical protein
MSKKEIKMKAFSCALLLLFVCSAAYPQTEDLGQGFYYSEEGGIIMAVNASLAVIKPESPYVMFMAFMASKDHRFLEIDRDNVVMIYKGQEYKMPTVKELRDRYNGQNQDASLYQHLGKESLVYSNVRFYRFPVEEDFFPNLGSGTLLATDKGWISDLFGFKTRLYFKNPGFRKGDEVVFKVNDGKNSEIIGQVAVILK